MRLYQWFKIGWYSENCSSVVKKINCSELLAFDKENVSLVSEVILIKELIIIMVTNSLLPGIEFGVLAYSKSMIYVITFHSNLF